MMQKYNESIYPILSCPVLYCPVISYPNESIPILLNDQNVSMTKCSKNMASYKKSVPMAQFASGLSRVSG